MEFEALLKQRHEEKKMMLITERYVDNFKQGDNVGSLIYAKEKLIETFKHVEKIQKKINACEEEDNSGEYEQLFKLYLDTLGTIEQQMKNSDSGNSRMKKEAQPVTANIKLPDIVLPKFNGDYTAWNEFRDIYESLIHKNDSLSNVQKLHYLKGTLVSPAANLICNLSMTNDNYQVAYDILLQRYNNKFLIINSHLQALQDISPCTKGSHDNLRAFLNSARQQTQALRIIHSDTQYWDLVIIFNLCSKLDHSTRLAWGLAREAGELPTLSQFYHFLENRASALETAVKVGHQEMTGSRAKSINIVAQKGNAAKVCTFCNSNHMLYACFKFKKLTVKKKKELLGTWKYCERCLDPAHAPNTCKYNMPCKICKGEHHTLLHSNEETSSSTQEKDKIANVLFSQEECKINVLLATVMVKILDIKGRAHQVRALLDSGSQANLITRDLAQRLQLPQVADSNILNTLQDGSISSYKSIKTNILSNSSTFSRDINCIVIDKITNSLPSSKIDIQSWRIPSHIKLADPYFAEPGPINMLIGAELFFNILKPQSIKLGYDLPILRNSSLGWVLAGPYKQNNQTSYVGMISNESLNEAISKFWALEEVEKSGMLHGSDKICEQYFQSTVCRDITGRYEVALPFIDDKKHELGDSLAVAKTRFIALEKRLSQNQDLYTKYSDFIKEYIRLGHAIPISKSELTKYVPHYYLPHHAVVKQGGSSKIRVVFDASSKTNNGFSLNEILHTGPKLQQELLSILVRFRCWKFVFITDIVKMYRQIRVRKADQDFQRIVWRNSPNEEIGHYRLTTVTYGTSAAPYLAIRCLNKLAEDEESKFPIAGDIIRKDCYVDDVITGANTGAELLEKAEQLTGILNCGGFELHKWSSNCKRLLQRLTGSTKHVSDICFADDLGTIKALGITWKFIPAHAPHFGGLWERSIRSMKYHLNRVIGLSCLTYEEYLTLLTQVEAIMNSRPLVPITDDSTDSLFLSPSHFLIGDIMTSIPEPISNKTINKLNIHKYLCELRDRFWTLWSTAYLAELQRRTKWTSGHNNLDVDSIVLIKEDHTPPLQWPAGRVVKVVQGTDGRVRVATVRTSKGLYVRPVVKLIPLINEQSV